MSVIMHSEDDKMALIERHTAAMKIKKGRYEGFRTALRKVWKDLTGLMDDLGIVNFSLWTIEDLAFAYWETHVDETEKKTSQYDEDGFALRSFAVSGTERERWDVISEKLDKEVEWISPPGREMRLMYQDFGIVRENKELIRHRVFATHLKGDHQEEYKRRHDALVHARNGAVTKGPDSNFSIWNAENYIFGYDEIDVTMETEETDETRRSAIEWETKMLEIMEWYTDDVDWITGERHSHVQRIGYHN